MNPNGSTGSIRHNNLAGLGTKLIMSGAYARNMPSGLRSPVVNIFSVHAATKFAPAESPANTIRLPVETVFI